MKAEKAPVPIQSPKTTSTLPPRAVLPLPESREHFHKKL
jgi:hypothetical protein